MTRTRTRRNLGSAAPPVASAIVAAHLLTSPLVARAEPVAVATTPRPHAYAIVVGSNAAGAGQEPLRFAEDDARLVAGVLQDLGRFEARDVRVLLRPGAADVLRAIDDVGAKARASAARGEQTEVVFYYSGHAKANAVNLAGDDLPLATLRDRLTGLPTALTLVVLDACQSGAFARAKGAEPAASFTYNSVAKLTQKGLAVIASSSEKELSQESDELRGSYFTHHLVTALRGAGDADGDGRVSLDEAYRYAYRRTLASTARTQVGEQHVTLETDLSGQGEVPVTYPAEARAQLELPGALDARVLVQHVPSASVVAEVQKAPGAPVRLAFAAGTYDAIVGPRAGGVVQCRLVLADDRVTPLDPSGCAPVAPDRTAAKGESTEGEPPREIDRWAIEGSAGFIGRATDSFTDRLETFGYRRQTLLPDGRLTIGASRVLGPHLAGLVQISTLSGDTYQRSIAGSSDTASFTAYGAGVYLRAQTDVIGRWLGVYAQAGGGLSLGRLKYQTTQSLAAPSSTDTTANYLLGGAVGVTVSLRRLPLTFFVQAGDDRAPAIHDLIGDTHDSGGASGALGLRVRLGDQR
jgi:hypothetical protein